MTQKPKGMMLLEVILSVALFSLLTMSLGSVFQKVYKISHNHIQILNEQEKIEEVLAFIKEEMIEAEGIRIYTESGLEVVGSNQSISEEKIERIIFIPRKQKTKGNEEIKEKMLNLVKKKEGYEIIYQDVLLADRISSLTVNKAQGASWITIVGSVGEKEEMQGGRLSMDVGYKRME